LEGGFGGGPGELFEVEGGHDWRLEIGD
jgi:hypothetical protein